MSKDIPTIVGEALEIASSTEREAFLERACAADPDLRRRVDQLLHDHAQAGNFLEQPASAATFIMPQVSEGPGSMIGPYKLLEQIGEGGFGIVFMAEQLRPVRRKVALKVIKPGMDSKQVVARFEAERQSLALMDDPHIARVLDAGATESGRPYFVMELVKGIPITAFCDEQRIGTRQRLELFIDVCRAIQHAHQKGIIHRDIKPSNVLVTLHDGTPLVKVIDFGIAKAMGQQLTDKTLFTGFAQLIGTPLYMSPEQAAMSAVDVDTRSDVYSLGVLLYELLTGTTPFDKDTLSKASHDEWRRIIREDEPPRPSTRISTLEAQALSTISNRRQIDPHHLSRQVRGDLDWIVMKALEKDRQRRYESPSSFAADVQRFLDDQPVEACPPSATYRLRKYGRRNRAMLTTVIIVSTALVLGTVVSTWQAFEATSARKLADDRLTLADERLELADERLKNEQQASAEADEQRQQASANLQKALDAVDQMLTRVGDEKIRDIPGMQPVQQKILADALNFYQGFLAEKRLDPDVRHRVAMALYRMFWSLVAIPDRNDPGKLDHCLNEALRLLRELHEDFPHNGIYQAHLALVEMDYLWRNSAAPAREQRFRSIIQVLERLVADPSPNMTLEALLAGATRHELAVVPRDVDQRNPRENVRQVLKCLLATAYFSLGVTCFDKIGDKDEAEAQLLKAIHVSEGAPGWNQWLMATCYAALSGVYDGKGRKADALTAFAQSLEYQRALLRDEPNRLKYRAGYIGAHLQGASLYLTAKQPEDAVAVARTALDAALLFAADYPSLNNSESYLQSSERVLIVALRALGRMEEAVAVADKACERLNGGPDAYFVRAELQIAMGNLAAARKDLDSSAGSATAGCYTRYQHALLCLALHDGAAYRADCTEMMQQFRDSRNYNELYFVALTCALAQDAVADMNEVIELARRAVEINPANRQSLLPLGAALFRAGRFQEALEALERNEPAVTEKAAPAYYWYHLGFLPKSENTPPTYAWYFRSMTCFKMGNPDEARKWFDNAAESTEGILGVARPVGTEPVPWNRRLTLELLRAEATALLGFKP